ncbi:MAG: TetR family transcriptional regulator [Desulfobulbaceae bacterium A2]|nr:MAG: TetR family transcriptional regulator [Desulfobulbaceae bacterium A2]
MAEESGRRERKRRQLVDHLADTAWALFQDRGYDAVTMEAIADAADVAKGTLYKHFAAKEALLRHRFHRDLAEALPQLQAELALLPTAAARLRAFFQRSAAWSRQRRTYLGPYLRFHLQEAGTEGQTGGRSGLDHVLAGIITFGQQTGEFRRDIDPALAAYYLVFFHLGVLLRWLDQPQGDLTFEYRVMLDLFVQGLEHRP